MEANQMASGSLISSHQLQADREALERHQGAVDIVEYFWMSNFYKKISRMLPASLA
jgi:hypothetical protein